MHRSPSPGDTPDSPAFHAEVRQIVDRAPKATPRQRELIRAVLAPAKGR